jgi:peptidoglycan-associated lipoprotein
MVVEKGSFLLLLGALAGIAGCGSNPPPATPHPAETRHRADLARPASQSVAVSEDILRSCSISLGNVDSAPKFDFDRSELSADDRDVLGRIAKCVTEGPLRGRALRVVGRTDPRGESEYNMGLGGHRAESVRSYLARLGVDATRLAETSRGELDATGRDEQGWRRDRRVDVLLR